MAAGGHAEHVKDVLLEHVLQDIKRLQNAQSDNTMMEDTVSLANVHVQALCEHMDRILLHGLRSSDYGYWPLVKYFTRTEAVQLINGLASITTSLGRGRAWLYLALNEQSLESYVRMFIENQDQVDFFYFRESFLKDMERLIVLQTLVAGLDYITFDLPIDCIYLDYGATRGSSTLGTLQSNDLTRDVEPSFISSITASKETKSPPQDTRERSVSSPPVSGTTDSASQNKAQSSSGADVFNFREPAKGVGLKGAGGSSGLASSGEFHNSPVLESPGLGVVNESEDSLQGSLSPHRSLSQAEGAASDRLKSSRRFDEKELEEKGDELVQRASKKSKSKKKKDKKKKRRDSDGLTQSLTIPSASGQEEKPSGMAKAEAELRKLGLRQSETRVEADSAGLGGAWKRQDNTSSHNRPMEDHKLTEEEPNPHEAKEDLFQKILEESRAGEVEESRRYGEESGIYDGEEMWRPAVEVLAEEEAANGGSGMESLLEGSLTRVLPASSKRLSLADELELAMEKEEGAESIPSESHDGHLISDSAQVTSSVSDIGDDKVTPFHSCQSLPVTAEGGGGEESGLKEMKEEEEEEEKLEPEEKVEEEASPNLGVIDQAQHAGDPDQVVYDGSPTRPQEITQQDREANDLSIDDNTLLVVALDVLFNEGDKDEEILRLVQLATPTGVGQQRTCYLLLSTQAVYIMRRDGIEGQFSRDIGIRFRDFHHIVAGLGWQSLVFVYSSASSSGDKKYILLTGSEAVSRSITDSIKKAAAKASDYKQSIVLSKDNDEKVEAIERELIKLGSETSMDLELYLMVNWEQLEGKSITPSSAEGITYSGYLQVKTTNLIGITSWKPSYFILRNGFIYQYSSEWEDVAKGEYQIRHCGGCQRLSNEGKQFAFSVMGADGSVMLMLAAASEEDMTKWSQVLIETAVMSPTHRKTCFSCALLLTQNMIHILQEDWSNQSVQLVASCRVTDVNDISVDKSLPLYCTISYDQENDQGVWLVCFNTQYELGKFELALGRMWSEEFQVDLQFSEVTKDLTRERAHKAVELMQGSRFRCDSVTRGRTEFTYSDKY